jgi:hypothetical protein
VPTRPATTPLERELRRLQGQLAGYSRTAAPDDPLRQQLARRLRALRTIRTVVKELEAVDLTVDERNTIFGILAGARVIEDKELTAA